MMKPTVSDLRLLLVQLKQSAGRVNSAQEGLPIEGDQDDEITRARARAEFDGVDIAAFAKALGLSKDP